MTWSHTYTVVPAETKDNTRHLVIDRYKHGNKCIITAVHESITSCCGILAVYMCTRTHETLSCARAHELVLRSVKSPKKHTRRRCDASAEEAAPSRVGRGGTARHDEETAHCEVDLIWRYRASATKRDLISHFRSHTTQHQQYRTYMYSVILL